MGVRVPSEVLVEAYLVVGFDGSPAFLALPGAGLRVLPPAIYLAVVAGGAAV
ncbi:MAG: hypothetical protein JW953_01415 [Anaerolineae bacterium]|nr:hypothetical protein [Anaerolineae bacterium]